jgi:hypothetical protein
MRGKMHSTGEGKGGVVPGRKKEYIENHPRSQTQLPCIPSQAAKFRKKENLA